MRLILVRHSESLGDTISLGHDNVKVGLTKEGEKMAIRTANFLAVHESNIVATFTSPIIRAAETAAFISKSTKTELIKIEELGEGFLGNWQGLTANEIERDFPELVQSFFKDPDSFQFPGGELLSTFLERIDDGLGRVYSKSKGKTAIIVTHWLVIAFIICKIQKRDIRQFPKFESPHCGITVFEGRGPKSLKLIGQIGDVIEIDVEPLKKFDEGFWIASFPIALVVLAFIGNRVWPPKLTDPRSIAVLACIFHWFRYWLKFGFKFAKELPSATKRHQAINVMLMIFGCLSIAAALLPQVLFLMWAGIYYLIFIKYKFSLREATRFASPDNLNWVAAKKRKAPYKIGVNLLFFAIAIAFGNYIVFQSITILLLLLYFHALYGLFGIIRDFPIIFYDEEL